MSNERILVIGGPQCGKSTYASKLNVPHYCGDPLSLVKRPIKGVTYLPENLEWSQGSDFIVTNWFSKPGPWVIEGVSVVRALRKWMKVKPNADLPADKIIYFINKHPSSDRLPGQDAMEKSIRTIWSEISKHYGRITLYREWL